MSGSPPRTGVFEEPRASRWVWVVPSALLHGILLGVWLLLPDPPREPPERRRPSVSREQAETLRRHVEDANLVTLRAQVEELQELKRAMALIRDQRMETLRAFEAGHAPRAAEEGREALGRFLEDQRALAPAYRNLLEQVRACEALVLRAGPAVEEGRIQEAVPELREISRLRGGVLAEMGRPDSALSLGFAGADTAEVSLEWLMDPESVRLREAWREALEQARRSHLDTVSMLRDAYGGNAVWALPELIRSAERFETALAGFRRRQAEGKDIPDWMRAETDRIQDRIRWSLSAPADPASLERTLRSLEDLRRRTADLLEHLQERSESTGGSA